MKSVWLENLDIKKFPRLKGDKTTDVLIIGGGIAGILCAYFMNINKIDYILVEAKTIGMGISKNTTAKITLQHSLIYNKLIKQYGINYASQYLEANKKALRMYQTLCKDIDCDFEAKPAFTYSTDNLEKIENEALALEKLNYKAELISKIPIPIKTVGAIKFNNQAEFNPMKFIARISENLNIYENTFIKKIDGNTAITDYGNINAKKIIIATHFPFINSHGSYFLKMYQHRSYVIALKNAQKLNGMYVDENQSGMSFRNYKDLLLIGGGDHRTGEKGNGYSELRSFAKKNYKNSKEKYSWATQDCMTLDSIPYIGKYSKNTKNLFVATGFNKWGMTSAMVSAIILSDMIMEKENNFSDVFNPSRNIIKPQLFINLGETLKNFSIPTVKRCPHLGCALKYNEQENSWDCPCHGSRFDEDGKIIDNPAMRDANV